MGQDTHRQGIGYSSKDADDGVDGGDDCVHGHWGPVCAGHVRGGQRRVQMTC